MKVRFFTLLLIFPPAMALAQDKVEAPVWNVGDRWNFTQEGNIEVIKAEQSGYILKFSDGKCELERQGNNAIFLEKSSRNRVYTVQGDKRKKYVMGLSKIFDFPFVAGKKWKNAYSATAIMGGAYHPISNDYSENYTVLVWEDVQVRAGRFKALKLEYKRITTGSSNAVMAAAKPAARGEGGIPAAGRHQCHAHSWGGVGDEIKNLYWYSPEVGYLIKCEYDKDLVKGSKDIFNWELASFQLKNRP